MISKTSNTYILAVKNKIKDTILVFLHFQAKMVLVSLCVADSPKQQHFCAHILNNQQSIFISVSKIKDVGKNLRDICHNSKGFCFK